MSQEIVDEIIRKRKKDLEDLGITSRMELWMTLHKRSEIEHNVIGIIGIIFAALSSQLSAYPQVLFWTGLIAALATTIVTFLNLKLRSTTYINAWRLLDKPVTDFLADRDGTMTLEDVAKAQGDAEAYIQQALHKTT